MNKKKLLIRLSSLVIFIFFLNFIASRLYWYSSIWWFDMPMHFLGGAFLALAYLYIFSPVKFSIWKLLLAVLLVGVGWEVFEIAVDEAVAKNGIALLDILSDLCFDLVGGAAASLYYLKRIVPKHESGV